ncbi:MAG: LysE family translocator [Micromonosporaceae bacterium]
MELPLSLAQVLAFVGLCALLAISPGANLAVVLRCAAGGNQRAAVTATAGLTVGKIMWAAASLVGLAALLAASATAYQVVRVLGAAYLVYLGVQALWNSRRRAAASEATSPDAAPADGSPLSPRRAFVRGLVGDVLNPKVGLFYATVFPQFIEPGDPLVLTAGLLLALHAIILMTWYPTVSFLLARAGRALRPGLTRAAERVMGGVLVALGIRVAAESLR